MIQIKNLRIPYQKNPPLKKWVAEHLEKPIEQIATIQVLKQSLDARNPKQHFLIYHLEVFLEGESIEQKPIRYPQYQWNGPPPLIIGAGPAGLFAAWTFLAHGIRPILFERGERTHARMLKISRYWRKGELDLNSNVCNGEGGAGTFSDGKLITRIKSPLISQIMKILVDYGAPSEITYVYNPHVGSNLIREVIKRMSDDLIARGADLRFNTQVDHLDICSQQVQGLYLKKGEKISGSGLILACGHSAGDFLQTLYQQGIYFEVKSFALGLRIEHPQAYINSWQYGKHAISHHEGESAQYKLTHHWDTENIGVYSFCMCPGGYVISSTTDEKTLVVNGMSNFHRNSPWANAAIVCSIPKERFDQNDPFSLMKFQRELEQKTYFASKQEGDPKRIPVQRLEDFLLGKKGKIHTKSSCPSGVVASNLTEILPHWITQYLQNGFLEFEKRRKGFLYPDALLHAIESRTSSPVRITRNPETLESINTQGLFPCGEGPGYAGGITSAAVDGMRAALAWIEKFKPIRTERKS